MDALNQDGERATNSDSHCNAQPHYHLIVKEMDVRLRTYICLIRQKPRALIRAYFVFADPRTNEHVGVCCRFTKK